MLGFYICIVFVPVFWILALIFAIWKEKATILLSGFNFLSKEEREKYDRKRMADDHRNTFFLWGLIMLFGALGSRWISGYVALAVFAVWVVLFIKDVHLDMDKAYGKYKKSDF